MPPNRATVKEFCKGRCPDGKATVRTARRDKDCIEETISQEFPVQLDVQRRPAGGIQSSSSCLFTEPCEQGEYLLFKFVLTASGNIHEKRIVQAKGHSRPTKALSRGLEELRRPLEVAS